MSLNCHFRKEAVSGFCFINNTCLVTPITMPYFSFQHLSPTGVNVLIRYRFLVSFTNMKFSLPYPKARLCEKGLAASLFKQRPLFHCDILIHSGHILYSDLTCFPSFSIIILLMVPSVFPNCVPFTFKQSPPTFTLIILSFRLHGGKHVIFV